MTQLSPHFTAREFASSTKKPGSRDDIPPEGSRLWKNLVELAENLEVLREELKTPITIQSGYRNPIHNARVKSKPTSQHTQGRAADIRISGFTPKQVAETIERLIADGRMKQGGIGVYPNFTHYDTRGHRARW